MRNLRLRRVSELEKYSVLKTDGLCVPAQTHGVGVVWEGGWALCVCVEEGVKGGHVWELDA